MAFKMKGFPAQAGVSPMKQGNPDAKRVISKSPDEKTTVYTKGEGGTYTKKVQKIKKGATSDKEWETKKEKTISAKKAKRQIKRKTKRAERSDRKADIKEVRAKAKTMRKDEGLTRADKKDIRKRKKATIKAIRNR